MVITGRLRHRYFHEGAEPLVAVDGGSDRFSERLGGRLRLDRDPDLLGDFIAHLREDRVDQSFAVVEVAVERADADSRAVRDHPHFGIHAVLGELLAGCREDAIAVGPRVLTLVRRRNSCIHHGHTLPLRGP